MACEHLLSAPLRPGSRRHMLADPPPSPIDLLMSSRAARQDSANGAVQDEGSTLSEAGTEEEKGKTNEALYGPAVRWSSEPGEGKRERA